MYVPWTRLEPLQSWSTLEKTDKEAILDEFVDEIILLDPKRQKEKREENYITKKIF